MTRKTDSLSMTTHEWAWLAAYCAALGVPSVLLLVAPLVGVPLGVVFGTIFLRALTKQQGVA